MKLYHFTAADHARDILHDGLTRGAIPLPNGRAAWGWMWLTDDPSFTQGWATRNTIACDRTEVRLTIAIPKSARTHLHRWTDIGPRLGLPPVWLARLNQEGGNGAGHWYVFRGRIPPAWVRAVTVRPAGERAA